MKKIYITPNIKVRVCKFPLLSNNSVTLNGYNGSGTPEITLENGGGVGEGTSVVPGAKGSNSEWDDSDW